MIVIARNAGSMPVTAFILPPLGPSGTTSFGVQLPVSGLPPGLEGVNLYEQVLVAGASGNGLLSSPSVISILE